MAGQCANQNVNELSTLNESTPVKLKVHQRKMTERPSCSKQTKDVYIWWRSCTELLSTIWDLNSRCLRRGHAAAPRSRRPPSVGRRRSHCAVCVMAKYLCNSPAEERSLSFVSVSAGRALARCWWWRGYLEEVRLAKFLTPSSKNRPLTQWHKIAL